MSGVLEASPPVPAASTPVRRARPLHAMWPVLVFLASAAALATVTAVPVRLEPFVLRASFFDLKVYREAAGVVLDGGPLYGARFGLGLGFTYPPFSAVLFTLLRVGSLRADEVAVTLVNVALVALIAHATLALRPAPAGAAARASRRRAAWLGAAVALWMTPVSSAIDFGQVDLLIAALVLVDLTAGRGRRWGGLPIGLAAALKLTPLVFVPYLVLAGAPRTAARAVGGFALSIALAFDVVPGDARSFFGGAIFDTSRVTGTRVPGRGPADQSLHGALLRLGVGPVHGGVAWLAACGLVGATALVLAGRAARRGDAGRGFVLTALAGLLVSPISWPHHWAIAVPGLLLLATAPAARVPRWTLVGAAVALGAASAAIVPVIDAHPVGTGLSLGGQITGDSYVLVALAVILVALLDEIRRRRPTSDAAAPAPGETTTPVPVTPWHPAPMTGHGTR